MLLKTLCWQLTPARLDDLLSYATNGTDNLIMHVCCSGVQYNMTCNCPCRD